ncbi:transglutaminase domain-containing protein [Cellulomonas denverensis]|uniref:Transglutaminase domain-containing protein n=1 Tax=Cellulomonas denverensis TaxID=264297 RepID=A0A7X6KWW6_9CELL|nr:transglutaminase domain-containing protein [Cellulomonas denverensis]NKY23700.1 transglutaminase domain-containing protein [Cellulomonas denverensis]GIG26958.1 transglutaminase [Cellulomonas denverensis]
MTANRGPGRVLLDVSVPALAVLAALTPLLPVYGGAVLLRPVAGGVVVGVLLALAMVRWRWNALVGTAVTLAVAAVVGGPFATPESAIASVLPTPASLAQVVRGAALGWKDVLTLQPPLGDTGWLLVPPYLLALIGTLAGVRLALAGDRWAPLAAVPAPLVLGAAVLLGTRETVSPVLVGAALGVVLLLWASWRSGRFRLRRPAVLALLLVLALGAGLGGGAAVQASGDRFVLRERLIPPFDPYDYPSPLSAFRSFVKEDDTLDLFTVTGLPQGARIRLATFDRFDGVVWNVAGDGSSRSSGQFRRVGSTVDADGSRTAGQRAEVEIEVDGLTGVWLPTVGQAESISFDDATAQSGLRYNDATGSAVVTGGLTAGTRYTIDTVIPAEPEDDQIGAAPAAETDLPEASGVPDAVATTAADAARDAGSPLEVARAMERALSEGGYFSHGLTAAGDYPSLSGHGADRLTSLLAGDLMVGDDEQYAAAMALMARAMGLPSRVVMGFVPGQAEDGSIAARDADEPVTVTGADIHAWVEIQFAGYGWITFDPTPPETQTPQEDDQTSPSEPDPQVAQPPPPPADPVDPPDDDAEDPQTDDPGDGGPLALWQRVLLGVAAGSGALLLLAAPFLVVLALKARRRSRRRNDPQPVRQVVGGWQEVLDLATDLRLPTDPVATRRETATALGDAFIEVAGAAATPTRRRDRRTGLPVELRALADRADAAVFGPGEPTLGEARGFWAAVDETLARMRAATPRRARWRGRFTTRSLRTRAAARRQRRVIRTRRQQR